MILFLCAKKTNFTFLDFVLWILGCFCLKSSYFFGAMCMISSLGKVALVFGLQFHIGLLWNVTSMEHLRDFLHHSLSMIKKSVFIGQGLRIYLGLQNHKPRGSNDLKI